MAGELGHAVLAHHRLGPHGEPLIDLGEKAQEARDIWPIGLKTEVVSTYKLVRKQANLFEARVGKGRLLVCTMNMTGDDPGTAFLKDAILRYAADDFHFRPTVKMDAAILRHYMDNPSEDVAVLAERAVNANREGNVDE